MNFHVNDVHQRVPNQDSHPAHSQKRIGWQEISPFRSPEIRFTPSGGCWNLTTCNASTTGWGGQEAKKFWMLSQHFRLFAVFLGRSCRCPVVFMFWSPPLQHEYGTPNAMLCRRIHFATFLPELLLRLCFSFCFGVRNCPFAFSCLNVETADGGHQATPGKLHRMRTRPKSFWHDTFSSFSLSLENLKLSLPASSCCSRHLPGFMGAGGEGGGGEGAEIRPK